jgi:hypothetical protein
MERTDDAKGAGTESKKSGGKGSKGNNVRMEYINKTKKTKKGKKELAMTHPRMMSRVSVPSLSQCDRRRKEPTRLRSQVRRFDLLLQSRG